MSKYSPKVDNNYDGNDSDFPQNLMYELCFYADVIEDFNFWARAFLAQKFKEQSTNYHSDIYKYILDNRDDFLSMQDIVSPAIGYMRAFPAYYYPLLKFYKFIKKSRIINSFNQIDGRVLSAFIKDIETSKLHPNTQSIYVIIIKSFLGFIESENYDKSVFDLSKYSSRLIRKNKSASSYLNDDELKQYTSIVDNLKVNGRQDYRIIKRNQFLFKLLIFTGARIDEILSLKWSDFVIERTREKKEIFLRLKLYGKGRKERYSWVFMNNIQDNYLAFRDISIQHNTMQDDHYVFHPYVASSNKLNIKLQYSYVFRSVQRIFKESGISRERLCGAHIFRHTFATKHISSGTPLPDLSAMLGHSRVETTLRYAHTDTEKMKKRAMSFAI